LSLKFQDNLSSYLQGLTPQRYSYSDAVVGLVWPNDPESYDGSSTATGRASHARQVKGDDPDKKRHPGPPGWGLDMRQTTPPHKNMFVEKLNGNNEDDPA